MKRLAALILALPLLAAAGDAHAQNFFERLFGITPSRPQPPPFGYQQPPPAPLPSPDVPPGDEGPRRAPAAPVQARPVVIRAPSEDSAIGRDLKLNGTTGTLRLERSGRGDLRARITMAGRKGPGSAETCTVSLGGSDGLALVSQGRPEGVARYQVPDATCPLQLDLLDDSVLVKGPSDVCSFPTVGCDADPSGLWGPEPSQLVSRARDFEQTRGSADKAVRDNYKVLTQRAKPEAVRPIVAEQASFSADRETVCRSYAREGTTNFCNARYTEARALALATRLGVTSTSSTQAAEARTRRRDPNALPSSDELMQRRPADDD